LPIRLGLAGALNGKGPGGCHHAEPRGLNNVLVYQGGDPLSTFMGDLMTSLLDKCEMITKLAADKRLTDAQFRAAVTLLLKFHNTGNGLCYPSLRQWAEASSLGRSTCSEAAGRLREIGVIDFDANLGGRQRRNSYRLNVRPGETKRSPRRTALNPYKYLNRGKGKTGVFSQPRFKPEPQINIPPPHIRAEQVARLAHMGVR
jgi:hypothetical protein